MKKKIDKWIAVILMVVMLPWQECYGAYVYGMDMTREESGEKAETETESRAETEAEDETASGSFEEMTQETNTEETTAAPENVFPETEEGQKTEAVQEPVQDGETDNADTMIELQNEGYHMEPIQMDIVNNLAEVIIREGKGEYQNNTLKLLEDIVIEGGTEFVISKEGLDIVANIDLNGHGITINGDFYQPEGALTMNGGSLIVNGNYICERYHADETGFVYENKGTGNIILSKDNEYVYIAKNFLFFASSPFSGGKIEVEGDFVAKTSICNGMEMIIHGNTILYVESTNSKSFVCEGRLEIYSGFTNTQTLVVEKSMIIKHGYCCFAYGNVVIKEDLIIEDNTNPGYIMSLGTFFIGGSLLDYSKGAARINEFNTLEIQGDIDVGRIYFDSYDNLILSGDSQQYITVRESGQFGTITNKNSQGFVPVANRELQFYHQDGNTVAAYIYDGYGYVKEFHLTEDTVVDGNLIVQTNTSYDNLQYNLTVTGDFIVENRLRSENNITVNGNMYFAKFNRSKNCFEQTNNNYGTCKNIEVLGNLYADSTYFGDIETLKLHGNLEVVAYIPVIKNFELCGTKEQSIKIVEEKQRYYLARNFVISNSSENAITVEGNPKIIGEITTNGHPIDGTVVLFENAHINDETYNGDLIFINKRNKLESVTINGNVEIQDNHLLGENVIVNGNLNIKSTYTSFALNETKLVVNGNFEANIPVNIVNHSELNIKGELHAPKISAYNSKVYAGTIKSKNQIDVNEDAFIEAGGDVYAPYIEIKSGSLNVKGNITAADCMVIQKDTCVSVNGSITTGNYFNIFKEADVTIHGDINAGQAFNIIKQDNYEENEPLQFDGNITADNIQMVASSVVIKGSVNCSSQLSISHFNDIHIDGDLTASKISLNLDPSKTTSLYVGGTLDCDMVNNNAGALNFHLEAAGDVIINEGMRLTGSSSLIFSGGQFQNVHLGPDCYFETVIVRNTSEEGMYINQPVSCKTFTNETDCKITYGQKNGTYGWTLRQDSTIYGDLNLIGGELNLNGYSLTVKGNFCQNGGSIISTKDGTGYRGTVLSIDGNYYYQPQDGAENELTVGIMEIHGNFIQNAGTMFVTGDNYTVQLYSYEEQHLNVPDASFGILELNNRNVEGIVMDSTVTAKKILVTNCKQITGESVHLADNGSVTGEYPGDLTADGQIAGSITVDGTLTAAGETVCSGSEINAKNLVILQPFYVQDGFVVVRENMTVTKNGILYMEHENGTVVVGGDFTAAGNACGEATLTAGTLEVKGNFIQRKDSTFVTGGSHRTVLSGRTVQSVTISDDKNSIFNILVVKKNLKTGYIFTNGNNEVYREIVYDYVDVEPPLPVGGLHAQNVTTTEITIQYEAAEDDIKTLGYEIYRDGERIAVTMDLSYCDKGLMPGTEYVYEVYPYDSYNNIAAEAEKFAVCTLEDTNAPNAVDTVFVASRSKTDILLEWGVPYDDSGIASYEIYRNGELLAGNCQETTYRDTNVELDMEYRYELYAVDLGGNRSEQGNTVLTKPVAPRLLGVTPTNGAQAGGAYTDIVITVADDNNLSEGELELYYRKGSEGEYLPVAKEKPALLRNGTTSYRAEVRFDLSQIEENGDYELKAVVTDNGKNKTDFVFRYFIDVEAPKKVELTKAESVNQTVQLGWEICDSGDCEGYYIYRMDEETDFVRIATIKDRFETTYTDNKTEADKVYTYAVAAYDKFGTIGTWSNEAAVMVDADKEAPVIVSLTPADGIVGKKIRMEVSSEDNIAVRRAAVYYRENETAEWKKITERYVAQGYACLEFTMDNLSEGSYEFMVKVTDGAGNESEGSIRRYTIDLTGPQKPVITQTVSRNTAVQLIWDFKQENDFSHFVIERNVLGAFIPVGKEYHTLGYTVTGLTPKAQYTFRVTAYDIYGNAGEPSEDVVVVTEEDTVLPTLHIESKTKTAVVCDIVDVSMTAFDNVGIREGRFSFSYDGKTFGETVTVAGNGGKEQQFTAQYQVKNGYEGSLWIRYEAEDTSGNVNETAVQEFRVDITPPDAVEDFKITSNLGSIELSWKPSAEEGITYCLYRAEGESGVYRLLAQELIGTSYCDSSVKAYGTYSYRIEAVDLAGNKSTQTNPVMATVAKDTAAPVVRGIGPAKSIIGANVTLSVLATDNYHVSRVRVSYRTEDGTEHLIEEFRGENEEFYQEFLWNTNGLESGTYVICVLAWDEEGNTSQTYEKTYTLDVEAPEKPEFTAEGGHFENNVVISSDKSGDFAYYEILRRELGTEEFIRIKTTTEQSFTDTSVKPFITYIYTVKEYDKAGNSTQGDECSASADSVDVVCPRSFLPEYMSVIEGKELTFDGTMSSDNVGIVRYQWNMGDGSQYSDSVVNHAYQKTGRYTVSLTVFDAAGNSNTTSAVVFVRGKSNSGNIDIRVCGEDGRALSGAYVFVEPKGGESYTLQADSMGNVCLADSEGTYELSAYSAGYLPDCQIITIRKNQDAQIQFCLVKDKVIQGNVSVRRLTIAELIEKGVDISNPDNYNTFAFTLDLYFSKYPLPTKYEYVNCPYTNSSASQGERGDGPPAALFESGGYCHSVYVQPVITEGTEKEPVYVILSITESMQWLKDIYEVSTEIVNSAGEKFTLEDMNAKINLPEGLSFARTYTEQKTEYELGTLASGQAKTADWLIKADKKGDYTIDVLADGILMPFAAPVSALFSVKKEFAADGDGLVIYIMAENCAYIGERYYVHYAVKNGTGKDLYNFTTTMGAFHFEEERTEIIVKTDPFSAGKKVSSLENGQTPQITYVLDSTECGTCTLTYGGENYKVNVFPKDDILYGTYSCIFRAEGDPEKEYYKLVKYIMDTVGEETGVTVIMNRMPSHITKYNLRIIDLGLLFADPVDTTTGAYLDRIGVVKTNGGSNISLDMDYNSMMTENGGELGCGWYHNYQQHIEDKNGIIYYYATPAQRTTFVSDEMKQGIVYGNLLEDGTTIVVDGSIKYPGRFSTEEAGLSGYYFMRGEDGLCSLYTPDGLVKKFDEQGRLCEITDTDGKNVTLNYTDKETVIQDMVSKSRIVLVKNSEGLISEIRDDLGNTATLTYENGFLSGYTDFAGYTVKYRYDADKKLIEKTSVEQTVTNTYDEKGRVLSQTNGNGTLSMCYEDGSDYHKTTLTDYQGNVSVVETDGNYNKTAFTDALGNRTEYVYDDKGNLIRETDSLGNTRTYEYNGQGYAQELTDENNKKTAMSYDAAGNVVKVQDEEGTAEFTYDDKNRLIRTAYANAKIRTYTYDENGYLAEDAIEGLGSQRYRFEDGRLKTVTDTLGNETSMKYDAKGQMISVTDALGNITAYTYDSMGRTSTVTNPLGETLRFEYDYSGNITKTIYPDGTYTACTYDVNNCAVTTTDRAGNVTKYTRDASGNLLKQENPDGTFETYTYDALGNETAHTDILGRTTTYTYDSASRLTSKQDADGNTTAYEYYNTGKLKKQTQSDGTWESYVYDACGNMTERSTPLGTTHYTYDIMGNVTSITNPLGVTTTCTYDKYDRLISETDGNGNITTYAYNAAGNCIGKTLPDKTHVKMTYDALGRLTSVSTVTSAYGEVSVRYGYDALGRVTKLTDELGETSTYEYDAYGNVTAVYDGTGTRQAAYTYDIMGNVLTETDAFGSVTQGTYDTGTGRLVSMVHNVNTVNEAKFTYAYDTAGRLVSVTDPLSGTSSYTYDKTGNIETLTDPNGGVTKYTYDTMGKITEICNAVGSTSHYRYNENGQLSQSENARGQKTDYTYDALGRTISFTDEAGSVKQFYDNNGNVLSVTETLPDGTTRTITRTYDCMNRVSTYTDYKGNTIKYGYDELGNLITLTYAGGEIVRCAYYPNGLLKSVTDTKGNITSYEYDSKGNVTKTENADGTVEVRSYNESSKLTIQETKNAAGALLSRYEYTYDENANITKTTGIDYGEIKKVTEAEYKYDAANRLISYNGKEVQYDQDGNMTYGPLDGEMVQYEYDCRNRLIKAGDTVYEYDAENNRIASETPEYREEYVINSNADLSQILTATRYTKNTSFASTAVGSLKTGETTTYTYGNGLVSQYTEENETEYYHYNNIGSTMYLTQNGVKTHEYAYSTYGELTLGEYGQVRFLYNGQFGVMTDGNGLYYMRARYYNPEIRRFINQDIVIGNIENSQSLNRYAYCQGNPVNYMDPFGLEPCEFFSGLGHGMLNLMGLIPGIGDAFDITNALWYALEGKWGRCFESGIAALPFIGNFLPDRRTCDYVRRILNIASYGGTGFLAGQGMIDGGQQLWTEINSGQCSGWSIALGVANIGLNGATLFFSGKGFVQETGNLNKMLKADGVTNGLLGPLMDNGGYLDIDGFKEQKVSKNPSEFNPSNKPYKNNKEANKQAQKQGYIDAHDLKKAYVGKDNISKYDMKYDTKTGEIYLESKNGKIQIPTGLIHEP